MQEIVTTFLEKIPINPNEVNPPATTSQGYTRHTCLRCGYAYEDSYTDARVLCRDAEKAVTDLCRRANAYIEAVDCVFDPNRRFVGSAHYPIRDKESVGSNYAIDIRRFGVYLI